MRFIGRNRWVLLFLALTVFCSIMVVREFIMDGETHVKRREDFFLLVSRGYSVPAQQVYQLLIQDLPDLNDRALADDLQRAAMVVEAGDAKSLLWKFQRSVNNELQKRAARRIELVVRGTEAK